MDNEKVTWHGLEKYFATEVIEQAKASAKRWFVAWLITFTALVGTIAAWIYA